MLCHDSADSNVSKGLHVRLKGRQSGWHDPSQAHGSTIQHGGGSIGTLHHW
ncbi:hypothetical protein DBR06_SOUSAS20310026, partial [Sousa chinensis]